ncbi:uncharacterized protein [Euphorbia lathyris]|uniref:uncharacterized protein isoform X1 n=1 Tax=Euphorbia lathyris TaxID=212925 RepID=UPI0033142CA9
MRTLALSLLLLSFFFYNIATAIRLQQGFMNVGHQNIQDEKSRLIQQSNGGIGEVIVCKEGNCKGRMKKRVNEVSKKSSSLDVEHWLPRIHEDYYGPRHHKPKHHL